MRGLRWIGLAAIVLVFFSIVVQLHRRAERLPPVLPTTRITAALAMSPAASTGRSAATSTGLPLLPPLAAVKLPLLEHPDPLIAYLRKNARELHDVGPAAAVPSWVHPMNRLSLSLAESLKSTNEHTPHYDGHAFTLAPDRVIIVVMTYARPGYVQRLLESLAAVDGSRSHRVTPLTRSCRHQRDDAHSQHRWLQRRHCAGGEARALHADEADLFPSVAASVPCHAPRQRSA